LATLAAPILQRQQRQLEIGHSDAFDNMNYLSIGDDHSSTLADLFASDDLIPQLRCDECMQLD
jgi:hypothetical protein